MNDLISRSALLGKSMNVGLCDSYGGYYGNGEVVLIDDVKAAPAVDAVEVVRCKDCRFYHKEHVRCNDGTEKDISEFPPEAFCVFGYVTGEYGINVGGQCEIEKNCGYAVDKSVYRQPEDFCSRGERRSE